MTYLFDQLDRIKPQLKNRMTIFIDYDGVLTPFTESSEKARLSQRARKALIALSKISKFQLTILSARSLAEVKQLVGIDNITYAGNHGFEIKGPGIEFQAAVTTGYKSIIEFLKKEIELRFSALPTVIMEDKGISISVHYHRVNTDQAAIIEYILYQMTQLYMMRKEIVLVWGKRACEIRPPIEWGKGHVVQWILAQQKFFPVYIGDNTTDEDAFIALKDLGITVNVGSEGYSNAQYYVRNIDEVISFLNLLHHGNIESNGF